MPDTSPDLPAGSRAEPADIVYADPHGDFLRFLETQDCVGLEPWIKSSVTRSRKYFIEVKTTTQNCDAVFHMSKAQHSRVSFPSSPSLKFLAEGENSDWLSWQCY